MCIVLIAPAVQSDSSFSIIRWFEWNKTNLNIYMSPYFNQVQKNTFLLATNHWKQTIQNADDEIVKSINLHISNDVISSDIVVVSGNATTANIPTGFDANLVYSKDCIYNNTVCIITKYPKPVCIISLQYPSNATEFKLYNYASKQLGMCLGLYMSNVAIDVMSGIYVAPLSDSYYLCPSNLDIKGLSLVFSGTSQEITSVSEWIPYQVHENCQPELR